MAPDGPKTAIDGPKTAQDGPKMAPRWLQMALTPPKICKNLWCFYIFALKGHTSLIIPILKPKMAPRRIIILMVKTKISHLKPQGVEGGR